MKGVKHIPIVFFAVCVILLSTQIFLFIYYARINDFSIAINILTALSQALLILSPYLLLKPKWRPTIAVPMVVIPIFLYVNLLYFRNFCDLMGFKTMFGFQNVTGTVTDSAFSSVEGGDVWFLIPLLLFLSIYILWFKKFRIHSFSNLVKVISLDIVALVFVVNQCYLVSEVRNLYNTDTGNVQRAVFTEPFHYNKFKDSTRVNRLKYYTLVPYIFREFYDYIKPEYRNPTEQELSEINAFVNRSLLPFVAAFDSLPNNRGKNLIIIIVESLNSDALNIYPNSKPAMPFLKSLLDSDSPKIFLDNILPQIGDGRSSDGRFIYNTGILPPPHDPVSMSHPTADYPSLAKAFPGVAEEFDIGNPMQWNKGPLSKSYGYRKIHVDRELVVNMKKLGGRDAALFVNSLPILEKLPQPFLATLCTMDMHDPYDNYLWRKSDAWQDSTFSLQERVYIEKLRQFDAALSQFIAGLKKSSLYDNSVIVIVSDHTARESKLTGTHFTNYRIPVIILNSGIDIKSSAPLLQSDVYPTLLDVMGLSEYGWRGFGISVFRNPKIISDKTYNLTDSVTADETLMHLSETMIETGYFNSKR